MIHIDIYGIKNVTCTVRPRWLEITIKIGTHSTPYMPTKWPGKYLTIKAPDVLLKLWP